MEYEFYDYMDFDEEHNRNVREFYVKFFDSAQNILELACGRGEFLQILKERGKNVIGVDIEIEMVSHARSKGLDVIKDDAFAFLKNAKSKYDGIFISHFIEHLDPEQVVELLHLCKSVLSDGGILVVTAPNPGCISTTLHEFWRDPTHVRMYDLPLVEFFLHQAGFEVTASGLNPKNWAGPPIDLSVLDLRPIKPVEKNSLLSLTTGEESTQNTSDSGESGAKDSDSSDQKSNFTRKKLRDRLVKFIGNNKFSQVLGREINQKLEEIDQNVSHKLDILSQNLEMINFKLNLLSHNLEIVNHNSRVVSENFREVVSDLYSPNELYAVGKK
jgi:SAM-dependent methyltransferase